jgi:hypothetical protein
MNRPARLGPPSPGVGVTVEIEWLLFLGVIMAVLCHWGPWLLAFLWMMADERSIGTPKIQTDRAMWGKKWREGNFGGAVKWLIKIESGIDLYIIVS